jgi:hypothetical protein
MKPIRYLFAAALCCAANSAIAGHDLHATIQPLVTEITLAPQAAVTRPLAVRIVDHSGQPLQGVKVWFDIAPCLPAATTTCPPLTAYGSMDGSSSLDLVTDHAGIAAVGSFVGGQGNADYEITAMVPQQTWKDKNLSQRGTLARIAVHQQGDGDIVPTLDGIYSSAARDGDGWEISLGLIGNKVVVVGTWYTFDEGKPLWLIGSADYNAVANAALLDLHCASGAKFGAAFNPNDVVRTHWGTAKLQWGANGGMQVTYTRQDGNTGTLSLQRIFPNP